MNLNGFLSCGAWLFTLAPAFEFVSIIYNLITCVVRFSFTHFWIFTHSEECVWVQPALQTSCRRTCTKFCRPFPLQTRPAASLRCRKYPLFCLSLRQSLCATACFATSTSVFYQPEASLALQVSFVVFIFSCSSLLQCPCRSRLLPSCALWYQILCVSLRTPSYKFCDAWWLLVHWIYGHNRCKGKDGRHLHTLQAVRSFEQRLNKLLVHKLSFIEAWITIASVEGIRVAVWELFSRGFVFAVQGLCCKLTLTV